MFDSKIREAKLDLCKAQAKLKEEMLRYEARNSSSEKDAKIDQFFAQIRREWLQEIIKETAQRLEEDPETFNKIVKRLEGGKYV